MRFPSSFSSEGTTEISQLRSDWSLAKNIFQVPHGRRTFSIVPLGRNFLRTVFQPLCGWLISGGRSATPLALAALVLFLAVGAAAQTNALSDADIQGRQLAQQILEQRPETNSELTGTLKIRDENGVRSEIPMKFEIVVTATNWMNIYEKSLPTNMVTFEKLVVMHNDSGSNEYEMTLVSTNHPPRILKRSEVVDKLHFAGDFSAMDLGLEFLHWPDQQILPNPTTLKRGRDYTLLESRNPNPNAFPNLPDYSRVLAWIDKETGGILEAEAYDAQNKLLKVFEPKSFKKVNGQWELQEMEIRNVQTGSRTRLEFDLKSN